MITRGRGLAALLAAAAAVLIAAPTASAEMGIDASYAGDGAAEALFGDYLLDDGVIAADGDRAVAAATLYRDGTTRIGVLRFDETGQPDLAFDGNGRVVLPPGGEFAEVASIAVDAVGSVYVLGTDASNGTGATSLLRLRPNGALDTGFGDSGSLQLSFGPGSRGGGFDLALDSAGQIVVTGFAVSDVPGRGRDVSILRLDDAGELDPSFGAGGRVVFGTEDYEVGRSVASLADRGACVGVQANGSFSSHATAACVDDAGAVTLAPEQSPGGGFDSYWGDVAALPQGGFATSATIDGGGMVAVESSLLDDWWNYPSTGSGWNGTDARALTAVDDSRALIVGSATAGPGTGYEPTWMLVDSAVRREDPIDALRVPQDDSDDAYAAALGVAMDEAGRALTLVRGESNDLSVARVELDLPDPVDPRDPEKPPKLILGRLRMPDTLGGLLRRGTRFSALCTADCSLRTELVASKRTASRLGLRNRVVDRFHGSLEGGVKGFVRMPVRGGVARKARIARLTPGDLGLRVRSQAKFRP